MYNKSAETPLATAIREMRKELEAGVCAPDQIGQDVILAAELRQLRKELARLGDILCEAGQDVRNAIRNK